MLVDGFHCCEIAMVYSPGLLKAMVDVKDDGSSNFWRVNPVQFEFNPDGTDMSNSAGVVVFNPAGAVMSS